MLSKSQIKYLRSLQQKKYRKLHASFLVEGEKIVDELIADQYPIKQLYATNEWLSQHPGQKSNTTEITNKELSQISSLRTPNHVIAELAIEETSLPKKLENGLYLALDRIQDPGNLGTIIRTADWFGIKGIFCSPDCAELYNSKTLQATMGSFMRIAVYYTELSNILAESQLVVYGALLDGEPLSEENKPKDAAILVIGNESQGISDELLPHISHKIKIPAYGKAESLNASIATAILCHELRKNL